MFELDYLTQRLTFTRSNVERPQMIAGYATTFSGDVAEIPVVSIEPGSGKRFAMRPANGAFTCVRASCWPAIATSARACAREASATCSATFSCASLVLAPKCGVATKFGAPNSTLVLSPVAKPL